MAVPDVNQKAEIYETLSALNMPLLVLSSTFKPCNRPDYSNRKRPNFSRVSPKSFRQNSIKNFSKTYTSLSLMIGAAMGKLETNTKSISAIRMTFSFTRKNTKISLPNSARKQPSRKPCKTSNHSPYHQGHLRVPFFFLHAIRGGMKKANLPYDFPK
jgi:hypothetical protein